MEGLEQQADELKTRAAEFCRSLSRSMSEDTYNTMEFLAEVVPADSSKTQNAGYEVRITGTADGKPDMPMTEGSRNGWTEDQANKFADYVQRRLLTMGKLKNRDEYLNRSRA